MAEGYDLRSAQDIVNGLFSEQQEEADDAPSDSETNSHHSDGESMHKGHNAIFLPTPVVVYSDEAEEMDDAENECGRAKKRKLYKTIDESPNLLDTKFMKIEQVSPSTVQSECTQSPDLLGAARQSTTPLQAWSLLFDDVLLDKIVTCTNQEIEHSRVDGEPPTTCNIDVTRDELNALLGLLYYSGFQKNNSANLEELWSAPFDSSLYRSTMSCNRFKFLIANLRFDDKQTRNERRGDDKFAPIRQIWQRFIDNCKNYYSPHEYCAIGEQLIEFSGTCPLRLYYTRKPDRRGMKFIVLNDVETFYMINSEPYIEKQEPNCPETFSLYHIETISKPIHETKRTIFICDNDVAKPKLIERMKNEYSLNVIAGDDGNGRKTIDCFDRLCHEYSTARKTQRWPMRVFYAMLDQGGINAYILYSFNITNVTMNRTSFLKDLIMSLLEPQLKIRLELPQLRRDLRMSIRKILNIEIPQNEPNPSQAKRCFECPRERDRKTRIYCNNCKRPVCDTHRIQLCLDCSTHD